MKYLGVALANLFPIETSENLCPIHGTQLTESPYENIEIDFRPKCENEWETAWIAQMKTDSKRDHEGQRGI